MEGQVVVNDFLHLTFELFDDFGCDAILGQQSAVVAVGNGCVDAQAGSREEVAQGFVEHEEERARVGSQAGGIGDVEELDVFVHEEREVQPFHFVVDLCAGGTVREVQVKEFIDLFQVAAQRNAVTLPGVGATDGDFFFHVYILG